MPVVIVSPDQVGLHTVSQLLNRSGYSVREATTSEEALRIASEQPDLIVIDFSSPDMNGLELGYQIKADPATASIPVLPFCFGPAGLVQPATLLAAIETVLQVRLEEKKYAALLEAAPDAVIITNPDGNIVQFNAQTERVFGYSRHELLGHPVEILVPERFRSNHIEHRRAYAAHPKTRPMRNGPLLGLRKTGEEFPAQIGLALLPSKEGVVVAAIVRDTSAQQRLEQELRQRKRELGHTDDWTKPSPLAPVLPLPSLLNVLRQYRLLNTVQLDQVIERLQFRFTDPAALINELIQRSWLTPYQANELLQGRGRELLLGQYILLEHLGEGSSGQVFKARHCDLGSVVAIKLIRKEWLDAAAAIRLLQREVRAARLLDHPNIVHFLDTDEVGSANMIVMEYFEGATDLARIVKKNGPLPVAQACDFIRQVALGLQHAYERGVVHRDIKPANLLLVPGSVVKILDMGIALFCQTSEVSTVHSRAQEGALIGTANYVAPEQALEAHTVDSRADLYSLGCTLYFLLTGEVPFPGGTPLQKLDKHRSEKPVPVENIRPDVPPGVLAVLQKLMAKSPEDRYQTPAEAAAALTAVLS